MLKKSDAVRLTETDATFDNSLYTWPALGMETERWRYVTVAECRASLRKPVPSQYDPRIRLKKGFKITHDALKKDLRSEIGALAVLSEQDGQNLDRTIMDAINFWLECAMQRYRILIEVSGSKLETARERVNCLRQGPLELAVVPMLKRYGNSKGIDLNIGETVAGFVGETATISLANAK